MALLGDLPEDAAEDEQNRNRIRSYMASIPLFHDQRRAVGEQFRRTGRHRDVEKRTLTTALAPMASACLTMRATASSRDSVSSSV